MNGDELQTLLEIAGLHVMSVADDNSDDESKERARVPRWWFQEFLDCMGRLPRIDGKPGAGRQRDLVEKMLQPGLTGQARADDFNATTVRVSRFVKKQSQTDETAEEIRQLFGLPRYLFVANDPTSSLALSAAEADPRGVLEAIAIVKKIKDGVSSEVTASARPVAPAVRELGAQTMDDKGAGDKRVTKEVRAAWDVIETKSRPSATVPRGGTVRPTNGGTRSRGRTGRAGRSRTRTTRERS